MMNHSLKHILFLVFISFSAMLFAQNNEANNKEELFMVRGEVIESDTNKPIPKVNIEVNGGAYTTTNSEGEFRINVKLNDELIIKHSDFETVYYIIKSNERITVKVVSNQRNLLSKYKRVDSKLFNSLLDSAEYYKKKDADKSITFLTDARAISNSSKNNAEVYEVLADVFFELKQYDLAITNYKISLQNINSNDVRLKVAKAYELNKNYQESLEVYNALNQNELSNWQKVILLEGIGDVYYNTKDYSKAIDAFNQGLIVAEEHLITPKVTDLNSKIAESYQASGLPEQATGYFNNSLNLASQENKRRAAAEKVKVADFQNKNQAYEDEIELRKEALEDIEEIESDSILDNESSLTPQKQKYKIGNAYALQNNYDSAIEFLEESIEEANKKEDLVVAKDATRKVSEVYRDAGNIEMALTRAKEYERLVDELYVKKDQEISQAARIRNDLNVKQNRIASLEKDRALSESRFELTQERNKSQQLVIYSLVGGLVLLLIAGYFMFKNIKQQKLNNNLLALKSLRSQMNPHFIFNALNSVNSFISSSDERTANKYLSDFSLLMRAVLENSEEDFIPLPKEIELLELYTKLEHFRFKDKFDYSIYVEENVLVEEFQIPPMLLQPYIENAVWHGLRYKEDKGQLIVKISQPSKDELRISITDDGIGRSKSKAMKTDNQKKHNSKGLGNIKKRVAILNEMYKDKVDVSIDDYLNQEDSGTKVVVTLKKD